MARAPEHGAGLRRREKATFARVPPALHPAVRLLLALALLALGQATGAAQSPPSAAETQDHWRPAAACPRGQVSPREYATCLYEVVRASEQALEVELANALMVIDRRSDLAPVQRSRWKALLDEAQSRFLLYRNFDCQSVAPFEGPRGIGNFEQRTLCMIEANTRRARDLRERYGRPAQEPAAAGAPSGPEPRPGAWTSPTPPAVE